MTAPEAMPHDRAIELLPWLANDSLEGLEREAVREHASSCVVCRQELEQLEALAHSYAVSAELNEADTPDMRRINAMIDAELERQGRTARIAREMFAWLGNPWRTAFVAQTLLLAMLGVFWPQDDRPEPAYTTLSTPKALPPGNYLRVVPDPSLSLKDFGALLERHSLTVANGPSDRGVYTLRFDDAKSGGARQTAIDELSANENVLFVQPVAGGERP
jgi:thiol-disulfide isomerase/thioredoxin